MYASYTRLFTDDNGVSHFEELCAELKEGFAVPPAAPLHFAEFLQVARCRWVGGPPDWKGDAPHPVPRRMLAIPVQGACEITAGDGTKRQLRLGDVLLAEDTWGSGHATRMLGDVDFIALFIELADAPA